MNPDGGIVRVLAHRVCSDQRPNRQKLREDETNESNQTNGSEFSDLSGCLVVSIWFVFSLQHCLEPQFEAELDHAWAAAGSRDFAEVRAAEISGGIPESRRVGDVVCFRAEIQ